MVRVGKLAEIAREWKEEICKGCDCYLSNKPALIFPVLHQKVMFISESPYNYPRPGVSRLEEFIENDLLCGLVKAAEIPNARRKLWPRNIFDFIYCTFKPIFSYELRDDWAEIFLRKVYWTHVFKKTLKCLKGRDKRMAMDRCFCHSFPKELSKIRPELIICASSEALRRLSRKGIGKLLKCN